MSGVFKDGAYYPAGLGEEMSEGEYQERYDADLSEIFTDDMAELLPPETPGSHHWRTRDGRVLSIAEMTTKHLDNAIAYFERHGFGNHAKLDELREERKKR